MSAGLMILVDGANVTRAVDRETFPEYLEWSSKGAGLFAFDVRPVTLSLLKTSLPVTPSREMPFLIRQASGGRVLLNGFIDEIRDAGDRLEITAYPWQLLLKDTLVGTEKNLKDSSWQPGDAVTEKDEIVREFHSQGAEDVRILAQKVLNEVNTQKGTQFYVTPESVPPHPGTPVKKFFGNILNRMERSSWWWKLLGPLGNLITWLTEDDYQIRQKNGIYYLIKRDFGVFQKLWISAGGLLNVSPKITIPRGWLFNLKILGTRIRVPSSGITLFDWGRWRLPDHDWTLPNIGVQITIYRLVGGGLQEEARENISVFPQPDFTPTSDQMNNRYGPSVTPQSSANISRGAIRAYLDEAGYNGQAANILTLFDIDERNSYAVITTHKKKNDPDGATLVLSFETPFDNVYELHYRNATAGKILRDLCVVSNRYWFADETGLVWLLPRGTAPDKVTIERRSVMELERRRQKNPESAISISRYEEDNRGAVLNWGIVLRKNEWDAIRRYYHDELNRDRLETRLKFLSPEFNTRLNHRADMEGESLGVIIEERQGLLEPISELTMEAFV